MPSRWSISCWMQVASRPVNTSSCALPCSSSHLTRQVLAFNPPGAFFEVGGERVRMLAADIAEASGTPGAVLDEVLTIGCGSGSIHPSLVQRAGRGVMTTAELLNGFPIPPGTQL